MSTPVSSWRWAQCPVFGLTLQDRCGAAGQSPEPHQGVRSIEQIGLIYSIIVLSHIVGSVGSIIPNVKYFSCSVGAHGIFRELRKPRVCSLCLSCLSQIPRGFMSCRLKIPCLGKMNLSLRPCREEEMPWSEGITGGI